MANYFNKKYLSLKNFKILKNDHKLIFDYFKKKKIQLKNKRIIDIGCGNASFIYFFKNRFRDNKFFGLDIDKKLINFNKKNELLKGIKFINKSCKKRFSKQKFDMITFLGTLSIFKDQKKIILNLLDHLNKNGFLVINCMLNKNDIDVDLFYKKYFKNKINLTNAIYIKSYQETKKFILKKVSKLEIIENPYLYKIKKSKSLDIYTIKIDKKYVRTSDLQVLYDQYLIIAKK